MLAPRTAAPMTEAAQTRRDHRWTICRADCLGTTVVDAMCRDYRVIVLRGATRTLDYPRTQEGEWANFIAIRHIEGHVGYTALTDDFISACDAVAGAGNAR